MSPLIAEASYLSVFAIEIEEVSFSEAVVFQM